MIYTTMIQHVPRSRKDSLVPIRQNENDVKIEIVDVSTLNGMELFSLNSDQFIEVVTSPGTPGSPSSSSRSSTCTEVTPRPRKRAKLDHMSSEEKAQHRKMMNRISAQSARDRQKAFINQQEKTIKKLVSDNESLMAENKTLTVQNEKLSTDNTSLKALIEELENQIKKMQTSSPVAPSSKTLETVRIKMEHPTVNEPEVTECCSSPEPAEGNGTATDHSFPVVDVDPVPIDDFTSSPEIDLDELAAFSITILSKENQLANLEQIMSTETSLGETRTDYSEELGDNESRSAWVEENLELITNMDIETATFTSDSGVADVDVDTDTESHSNHAEALPLVEAGFDLLPIPTSPSFSLSPAPSDPYYEDEKLEKPNIININNNFNHQFSDSEKFDHFNMFLDNGCEIIDRWDKADCMDAPLFPDLSLE